MMEGEMSEIAARLRELAKEEVDSRGRTMLLVAVSTVDQVAGEMGNTRREVEIAALRARLAPRRYARNLGTVGYEGQIALLEATVGVVGVGGLGGWVVEGLARMGVGHLVLIDGDVFQENNLNRQAFCVEGNLGQSKVEAAQDRVLGVNAAVEVDICQVRAGESEMTELLSRCDVVVDALDALPIRLVLQGVAKRLGVPLVHGAIAGFVGQVMTILPGDPGLAALYGQKAPPEHGIETEWGNPSATPLMVAAWQIQEVVKLLTGKGEPLRRRMLFLDGEVGDVDVLRV
jgi:molybdopterin/thiamine biosynthesis adenylyltransferase